jgi:diadenylate cyclase
MTEVSDALVIVVSEETGAISVSIGGILERNINAPDLRKYLRQIQLKSPQSKKSKKKEEKENEKA